MKADEFSGVLALHGHWLRTGGREGRRASLNGADLCLLDLAGVDLTSALLAGANLERANLRGAKFANADLREAKLSYANLDQASLAGANLDRAEGRGMSCHETDLSRATLREASLDHCTFYSCDFSGADAAGAIIRGGEFFATNLRGANFAGACMPQTNLSNCTTENTDFTDVRWSDTKINVNDENPEELASGVAAKRVVASFRKIAARLHILERLLLVSAVIILLFLLLHGITTFWLVRSGGSTAWLPKVNYPITIATIASTALLGVFAGLGRLHIMHKAFHFRKSEFMDPQPTGSSRLGGG
jgi:uncharacterized protein YjbI with pentapeptide repeats